MSAVVGDVSALVALLVDDGPDGTWADAALGEVDLLAPCLVGFETASVIRRHERAGQISTEQAALAHADLRDLAVEHWPYELLADRAWSLRSNLTIHDACHVALAELVDAHLVTLARRMRSAPGLACPIETP